jgi:hypothetical protein
MPYPSTPETDCLRQSSTPLDTVCLCLPQVVETKSGLVTTTGAASFCFVCSKSCREAPLLQASATVRQTALRNNITDQ